MLRLHSNSFRILDSLWSPIKREVRPEELKNRSQDTQHAALIQELMSKKNFDQKKQAIAQHLADLRKRGVLKDVSSELGFYTKQRVSEVDDASVHALVYSSTQCVQCVCQTQKAGKCRMPA